MKPPAVTVVPKVDATTPATERPIRPSPTTIVPTFNVEQYARATGSKMVAASDEEVFADQHPTKLQPPVPCLAEVDAESPETDNTESMEFLRARLDERPVRRSRESFTAAGLTHRAAFVLLHVDGVSTVRELAERCGIPREEALGTLAALLSHGVISLSDASAGESGRAKSGIRELAGSSSTGWGKESYSRAR